MVGETGIEEAVCWECREGEGLCAVEARYELIKKKCRSVRVELRVGLLVGVKEKEDVVCWGCKKGNI